MQQAQLKLKEAGVEDLKVVAQLAATIWKQHYVPIIGKQQVAYMLNRMYSHESLVEQLQVKHHRFFMIGPNEKHPLGFVSIHQEKEGDWFLNKFYILPDQASKGLGTAVLEHLKNLLHPKKITLTVNRLNYKSINFYFKNGFSIRQVADFDIGEGYVMNDFVMEWRLK